MRTDEFERLYADEAQGLLAFLVYRTGDRGLAEDLLADAFERVLRSGRFDRRRGTPKAWLYTIALNLVRDQARRAAAERRAYERTGAPPDAAEDARLDQLAHRDTLSAALASLADEEREAVALRFGADLTVPEIAGVLGEPLTTVEGRVYRALRKLRDRMEP